MGEQIARLEGDVAVSPKRDHGLEKAIRGFPKAV